MAYYAKPQPIPGQGGVGLVGEPQAWRGRGHGLGWRAALQLPRGDSATRCSIRLAGHYLCAARANNAEPESTIARTSVQMEEKGIAGFRASVQKATRR